MKRIKQFVIALALIASASVVIAPVTTVSAISVFQACPTGATSQVCSHTGDTVPSLINNVVNILLYFVGAIAVIMIIIGGIKYTVSNGDASGVSSAKNTILYSVVGLIVAFMAYAIVNWVVARFV